MLSRLFAMFLTLAETLPGRVLQSLGIGLVSYAAIGTAINAFVSALQTAYNGLSGSVFAILSMAGFTDAFGIITGALIAKASLTSIQKLGRTI